jgi:hypothetical protein
MKSMNAADRYKNLSLAEKEKAYKWLKSQQLWHERRTQNAWHKSQSRWYRKQSMAVFNFSEIVSRTIMKNAHKLVDAMQRNSTLFEH